MNLQYTVLDTYPEDEAGTQRLLVDFVEPPFGNVIFKFFDEPTADLVQQTLFGYCETRLRLDAAASAAVAEPS